MKKILLAVIGISTIASSAFASTPTFSPQNTTNTNNYNTQYNTGVGVAFGAYPNADIYYDGTNLVIDVIHGGGKVSLPDGVDLGGASMSFGASLVFDGATADSNKTTLTVVDPTGTNTITLPNSSGATILSPGGVAQSANAVWGANSAFIFEGTTADAFETTLTVTDPTADQTWTIPNFAVDAAFIGSTLTTNNVDAANSVWGVSNGINFEGATADSFETTITVTDPTADRIVTIPNATGTVILGGNTTITAGANTACNTTCGSASKCIAGQDAGASNVLVACSSATADVCICSN